jgi:hypothetical protein
VQIQHAVDGEWNRFVHVSRESLGFFFPFCELLSRSLQAIDELGGERLRLLGLLALGIALARESCPGRRIWNGRRSKPVLAGGRRIRNYMWRRRSRVPTECGVAAEL